VEQSREHLNEPQHADLEARLIQLDTMRATIDAAWPDIAHLVQQDIAYMQQRYELLERHARAATAVALGMQDVAMRIEQVQQAIDCMPPSDEAHSGARRVRVARSPSTARARLAQIVAHKQRLQKRHQKLEQHSPADEEAYVQRLAKLADDFSALEQRGLTLWRKLAPDAFEASIAPVRAFQADAEVIRARLPSERQHDTHAQRTSSGTDTHTHDSTGYQDMADMDDPTQDTAADA
jgi:predicted  nucleic acid-binding Zn-ribbon protein